MIEDLKHLKDVLNRYIAKYERNQLYGQDSEELDLKELGSIIHRFIDKYEKQDKKDTNNVDDFKQRGMWVEGNDYY